MFLKNIFQFNVVGDTGVPGSPVLQKQLLLPEIPVDQNAAESWESLAEVTHTKENSLRMNDAHKYQLYLHLLCII